MIRRYLVIWYDGNDQRASLVDDDDAAPRLPHGFDEREVLADNCEAVNAVILCADAPHTPFLVLNEYEIAWPSEADAPATGNAVHHGYMAV